MKTRILLAPVMVTGLFFLASCASTCENTGITNKALVAKTQNEPGDKKLTDAEKKALIEADLWLPADQKPAKAK